MENQDLIEQMFQVDKHLRETKSFTYYCDIYNDEDTYIATFSSAFYLTPLLVQVRYILKEHSTWYAKNFRKSTGIIGYLEDENIHKPIYGNDCSKKIAESPQEKNALDLIEEHLKVW